MEVRVRRVVGGDEEEKLWMLFALSLSLLLLTTGVLKCRFFLTRLTKYLAIRGMPHDRANCKR